MTSIQYLKSALLVLVFPLLLRAQSLSEVVNLALKANTQILAADQNVKAQEASYNSAFAATLPRFHLDASYRYVSKVAEINFSRLNLPGPVPSIQLGTHDSYDSGITMDYVLFSGFAQKSGIDLAGYRVELAKNSLEQQEENNVLQAIKLYRGAQQLMLEKESLTNARKRAMVQLDRLHSLLRNGFARPVDTLTVRQTLLNIDQKGIALETARKNLLEQLSNVVGKEVHPQAFTDKAEPLPVQDAPVAQHPLMRALQVQYALLGSQKNIARSAYYPKVAVQGAIKYGRPGVDPIQDKWMTYGVVGIGLSWEFWNWGADRQKIAATDHQQKALQLQQSTLQNDLTARYNSAYRQWKSQAEELKVLQAAVRLAKLKWQIVSKQFKEGAVTSSDVNDANLALSDSEINVQRKKIEKCIKRTELDYLSGLPVKAWSLK